MSATVAPSAAARRTSHSRPVNGFDPIARAAAASCGSTMRSPRSARRMAVASSSAGASLTRNRLTPACMARVRYPGRPNVVRMRTLHPGKERRSRSAASSPSMPGISMSRRATSGRGGGGRGFDVVAAVDLRHDLHVRLEGQQRGEGAAHHVLVLGEKGRGSRRHGPLGGLRFACRLHQWNAGAHAEAAAGRRPCREAATRGRLARSCSPSSPLPSLTAVSQSQPEAPWPPTSPAALAPSSVTSSVTAFSPAVTAMLACVAELRRTMLVVASRTTHARSSRRRAAGHRRRLPQACR